MTKKLLTILTAAGLLAVAPAVADCPLANPADCVYVDDSCTTTPGTGTDGDPFCTIQDAINSVLTTTTPANPATILVRAGTYPECVDASDEFDPDPVLNNDRPVQLVADEWLNAGSPNPDPVDTSSFEAVALLTEITGVGLCDGTVGPRLPALSIAGTGSSVKGFAITGGGASGVEARGSVRISNNLVHQNLGVLGGGIQLVTAVCAYGDVSADISHNVVRDNVADDLDEGGAGDGGGIFVAADGSEPAAGICTIIGGKSEVTITDNVVHDNLAQNLNIDFVLNDTFAGGGGISVETFAELPFDVPEDSGARIVVSRNTVFQNIASSGLAIFPGEPDGASFGGGIFASTLGFGVETIELEDNILGPGNTGLSSGFGTSFGGGISASVTPVLFGFHQLIIRDNSIVQNGADVGGGIDVLAFAQDLDNGQSLEILVDGNTLDSNASIGEAGGANLEFNAERSIDVEDAAAYFPAAPLVADELSFVFTGNAVTDNTSGTVGAGVVLRPAANADPLSPDFCIPGEQRPAVATIDFVDNLVQGNLAQDTALVGGSTGCSDPLCESVICSFDSFCCEVTWDQICADEAAVDPNCDCGTSDCCISSESEVIGAGALVIPTAKGESLATVDMTTSTVVDNQIETNVVGFVGGVELASATAKDCLDTLVPPQTSIRGSTALNIDRCIIAENHADGVGGPPFDPTETQQVINVIKSSVYGNGDDEPFNDPDLDYEDTLFPDGPPQGNILDDPLLDPLTFTPDLCSPVYDVGSCSDDADIVCFDDSDCSSPNECVAEGAGYLASPDLNDDDALDGIDLVRFSVAFATEDVDVRYNSEADIDRDGMIDGDDLPFIAPLFGRECTP